MTCWGKWNATWHFVSKLFYWCLSVAETLIEWLCEAWDVIHVYFRVKTSSKEEGMIALRATVRTEAFIQRSVVPHQRRQNGIYCLNFLKEIDLIWKMRLCFLSKVTIYKTGSFQGSSTRAVVITMLYLFGTHAYQTERIIFGTSTIAPLLDTIDLFVWSFTAST